MSFLFFRDFKCGRPEPTLHNYLALGTCLDVPVGVGSITVNYFASCPNSGTPILLVSKDNGCPVTESAATSHVNSTFRVVSTAGDCAHLSLGNNIGSVQFACPTWLDAPAPTATARTNNARPRSPWRARYRSLGLIILGAYMVLEGV